MNYGCQTCAPVFTRVPIHIKHISTGILKFLWLCKRRARHSKDVRSKSLDLGIRIFRSLISSVSGYKMYIKYCIILDKVRLRVTPWQIWASRPMRGWGREQHRQSSRCWKHFYIYSNISVHIYTQLYIHIHVYIYV